MMTTQQQLNPQIIKARPPNFEAIVRHFPQAGRGEVIFAYYPHIYAPRGNISPSLYAHECVHLARQEEIGVEVWWRLYITEPDFRYAEELLAHRAEYQHLMNVDGSRNARRSALKEVARKLAHSLYGYGPAITTERARGDLIA